MAKTAKVLYDGVLAARLSETDDGYVLQDDEKYLSLSESKSISLTHYLNEKNPTGVNASNVFTFVVNPRALS